MNAERSLELHESSGKNIEAIKIGRTYACIKEYDDLSYGSTVLAIDTACMGYSIVFQVLDAGERRPVTLPLVMAGLVLRELT